MSDAGVEMHWCRKCGDEIVYHPEYGPKEGPDGRNRLMCIGCIGMLL
jgi:hypothetical protein